MLSSIRSFFDCFLQPADANSRSTTDQLQLACAALLVEISAADQHASAEEKQTLNQILRSTFGLDNARVEELWQLAAQESREATSLYQFTSLINANYGYQQKTALLQQLWQVAYADGRIDRFEEHLIRRIADLLHMTHGDFIRAKLASKPE
jgi:uncharacterized tellurite resistance protein B-like protein